jgi:3,4-dihydroxy 2-butanone 4-phosphate synthase/GTP cyclohydrolase II
MTNNPRKRVGLEHYGASVSRCEPLVTAPTVENVRYLAAKRAKMGHLIEPWESSWATGSDACARETSV